MPNAQPQARLGLELSPAHKRIIEQAAASQGKTPNEFAATALIQAAQQVLAEEPVTRITERDRKLFAALLDDQSTKPAESLVAAVQLYREQVC